MNPAQDSSSSSASTRSAFPGIGWIHGAAALCALAAAFVFLVRALPKITYPYLINLGEPALAQSIRYVQLGIWPYHDLSAPPYSVVPYGPVYLGLAAAVQRFFELPMAGGRLVCLTASIAAAVLIGLIVRRASRSWIIAAGSGAFFLSLPFVERWGVQVNVDMTATALELAAAAGFFFYASSDYSKKKYLIAGILAAVAAVFTKSSAAAAALAWGAHLLLGRRWRDLAFYAAVAGGAVLGIYAALNLATAGQYYFHTTYEISRRLFFSRFILDYWRETALTQPLNVAAALGALVLPVCWGRGDERQRFLNLYLSFTVLLTVSLGKQGSDTNYLLPFLAASTLAAGRLWGLPAQGSQKILTAGLAVWMAAQAVHGGRVLQFLPKEIGGGQRTEQTAFYDGLSRVIRKFPDPIICWDMALLTNSRRPIYFEPFPMAQAAYSGVWDQTPILEDLRAGKISLIVTYFWSQAILADRNFTPEFVKELRAHYRLIGQVKIPWAEHQVLFFYAPKKSAE